MDCGPGGGRGEKKLVVVCADSGRGEGSGLGALAEIFAVEINVENVRLYSNIFIAISLG